MNATIQVKLTEADVAKIRSAFAHQLNNLGEADMDDEEARALVNRLSEAMEKRLGKKYTQQF